MGSKFQTKSMRVASRRKQDMNRMIGPPVLSGSSSSRHTVRRRTFSRTRKMYPCIGEISRVMTPNESRSLPPFYKVPSTKLRNVLCVLCKSKFYVSGNSSRFATSRYRFAYRHREPLFFIAFVRFVRDVLSPVFTWMLADVMYLRRLNEPSFFSYSVNERRVSERLEFFRS